MRLFIYLFVRMIYLRVCSLSLTLMNGDGCRAFVCLWRGASECVLPTALVLSPQNECAVLHVEVNKPLPLILLCFICSAKDWTRYSAAVEKYINLFCCETS